MSYKLTSLYNISHGHAVALTFPDVWRFMYENINKYEEQKESLMNDFMDIANALGCKTIESAIQMFEDIYSELDLTDPTALSNDDIQILGNSVNVERLNNNPVSMSRIDIEQIYNRVLN